VAERNPPPKLALNEVHQIDCVEGLKQITPGSIHLAFADPPFNIGYEYDVYEDKRPSEEYLAWCRQWMQGVFDALKRDGTFWLAIGDEYAAELKLEAQRAGFHCRSWVVWYYTFGVNCTRGFSRSHTHLFYFVKHPSKFTFNDENPVIRVPSARQLVYGDIRANPKGRLPDNTWFYRPQDIRSGFSAEQDSWYFARVAGTFGEREGFHGCQMPEQLLGRIIRCCSNPLDIVLDPFAGSGTTLAVAKKLNRRFIGFELSKEYVERVRQRLAGASVGHPLDGVADPRTSAPPTAKGRKLRGVRLRRQADGAVKAAQTIPQEVRDELVQAYVSACDGHSVDWVLADPDLNSAFADACKLRGVPGTVVQWNRGLLTVRKQGELPRIKQPRQRRVLFRDMDPYAFASEIAMQLLRVEYELTLDELLCNPKLAAVFDEIAQKFAPGFDSFQYRWAALAIRKAAKTWKELARKFRAWASRKLPAPIALSKLKWRQHTGSGVYVLAAPRRRQLYVGQTIGLAQRIAQIVETPSWQELEAASVRVIPTAELPFGLQSILVDRCEPLLNSRLLLPEFKKGETQDPTGVRRSARRVLA
jgi:site-specific DNA-methyltransferase (adenine-specific)